uniref:Uncharacterized protein n=1 Tax=Anguilla anguilla TaxID=7936 RepID=A0A0E9QDD4_ANGAN
MAIQPSKVTYGLHAVFPLTEQAVKKCRFEISTLINSNIKMNNQVFSRDMLSFVNLIHATGKTREPPTL